MRKQLDENGERKSSPGVWFHQNCKTQVLPLAQPMALKNNPVLQAKTRKMTTTSAASATVTTDAFEDRLGFSASPAKTGFVELATSAVRRFITLVRLVLMMTRPFMFHMFFFRSLSHFSACFLESIFCYIYVNDDCVFL